MHSELMFKIAYYSQRDRRWYWELDVATSNFGKESIRNIEMKHCY